MRTVCLLSCAERHTFTCMHCIRTDKQPVSLCVGITPCELITRPAADHQRRWTGHVRLPLTTAAQGLRTWRRLPGLRPGRGIIAASPRPNTVRVCSSTGRRQTAGKARCPVSQNQPYRTDYCSMHTRATVSITMRNRSAEHNAITAGL